MDDEKYTEVDRMRKAIRDSGWVSPDLPSPERHYPTDEEIEHRDACVVRYETAKRALAIAKSNLTEGKLKYELSVVDVIDNKNDKTIAWRDKANRDCAVLKQVAAPSIAVVLIDDQQRTVCSRHANALGIKG
jgi:hypothetical protein